MGWHAHGCPRYEAKFWFSSACGVRPFAHTLGVMRRTALIVIAAVVLVSCSGGSDDPPVASRDVTGITDPVLDTAPESTVLPEPLDYAIEWTQLSDRVDEGTLTVPLDYADPQGDTIDLYVARHRASADHRQGRCSPTAAGRAPMAPPWRSTQRDGSARRSPTTSM
jgi:hypothetical protein